MYRLEFLPIAMQDMTEIMGYISQDLSNPTAAERLANEMIEAAERLTDFPYINSVHLTVRPLKHEYRKQIVKSYIMLYWIDEQKKLVTISRVIYGRRDYEKLL